MYKYSVLTALLLLMLSLAPSAAQALDPTPTLRPTPVQTMYSRSSILAQIHSYVPEGTAIPINLDLPYQQITTGGISTYLSLDDVLFLHVNIYGAIWLLVGAFAVGKIIQRLQHRE